jgi:hypothetical protein
MIDIATAATCFAIVIGSGEPYTVISGYTSLSLAEAARDEMDGPDAVQTAHDQAYEASPQYAIDQARMRAENEAPKNDGPWAVSIFPAIKGASGSPARVIVAPEKECAVTNQAPTAGRSPKP